MVASGARADLRARPRARVADRCLSRTAARPRGTGGRPCGARRPRDWSRGRRGGAPRRRANERDVRPCFGPRGGRRVPALPEPLRGGVGALREEHRIVRSRCAWAAGVRGRVRSRRLLPGVCGVVSHLPRASRSRAGFDRDSSGNSQASRTPLQRDACALRRCAPSLRARAVRQGSGVRGRLDGARRESRVPDPPGMGEDHPRLAPRRVGCRGGHRGDAALAGRAGGAGGRNRQGPAPRHARHGPVESRSTR